MASANLDWDEKTRYDSKAVLELAPTCTLTDVEVYNAFHQAWPHSEWPIPAVNVLLDSFAKAEAQGPTNKGAINRANSIGV